MNLLGNNFIPKLSKFFNPTISDSANYDSCTRIICYYVKPMVRGGLKDMSPPALSKVKKHLLAGKTLELKSIDNASIRVKQGPSRHANTKEEGCVLSVVLTASTDSELSSTTRVQSQVFLARTIVGHIVISSFRRYRFVSSDPLGIETSETALTMAPSDWNFFKRATTIAPCALLSRYCISCSVSLQF